MRKKTYRVGIIGGGLMGKEFASAAARWCHVLDDVACPEITGICDPSDEVRKWFEQFSTVKYSVADYRELLDKKDIDIIYCAIPHNQHAKVYVDIINAGKHFMGEKPFGMDYGANEKIMEAILAHPEVFARCSSQHPFYPACQEAIRWVKQGRLGKIIEVKSGFCHSSDLDLAKPVNWKRMVGVNGEYGCMGDLGIHTMHVPFHLGFRPENVYAKLSNVVTERPDGKGGVAPCLTWDNATLICDARDKDGSKFPIYFENKRMAPACTNRWYIEIYGIQCSVKFSTDDANGFWYTQDFGKEQAWCRVNIGYKPEFRTITGSIFEFGFTDAVQQMWVAFFKELEGKKVDFGCFRPEETEYAHRIQTAALISDRDGRAIDLTAFNPHEWRGYHNG